MKIAAKKFLFFTEKGYCKIFEQAASYRTSSASNLIKISMLIIPMKGQAK
jgi:hypothetical protein